MISKHPAIVFSVFCMAFLFACSDYGKLLKSKDLGLKNKRAIAYYKQEDYVKAYPLFEELLTVYKGTRKAEKLYYYYAYCEYHMGDFVMAGHHFKEFTRRFPKSELVEECQFMSAFCYYRNSPVSTLDQTNTYSAIHELQLFANLYPSSERIDSCNKLMDKLREKLETKAFDNAKLHFHIRDYKSAIIAFQNMLQDYPDTKYRLNCMYYIIQSNYLLASGSVDELKVKRFENTLKAIEQFRSQLADSKFFNEIELIRNKLIRQMEMLVYNLCKTYTENKEYEKAIDYCKKALKKYPGHKNKDEIQYFLIYSEFHLALSGNIRLRKSRLEEALSLAARYLPEIQVTAYQKKIEQIKKTIELEIKKLPVSIPLWYKQHGNYSKAIELFSNLVFKQPEGSGREKLSYMLLDTYYQQALHARLSDQYAQYARLLQSCDSLMTKLNGTIYEKKSKALLKKAERTYAKLPCELPMTYYKNHQYQHAIRAMKNSLQTNHACGKKDRFAYLILKSEFLLAVKTSNIRQKESRIESAIKSCEQCYDSLTSNKVGRLLKRCNQYHDKIILEPLVRAYRKVLYEKRNFAVHVSKTMALYHNVKTELNTEKGRARADKIYNSTIKIKAKILKIK